MRIPPLSPETLSAELRSVHDEIIRLIMHSQGQVVMTDAGGALLGPFPVMLQFPQFGIPALNFIRSLDMHARLDKKVREVAILTVAGRYGARFELYVHEIMAAAFGLDALVIAALAAGGTPAGLSGEEQAAWNIAHALAGGSILPDAAYQEGERLLGREGVAELIFLIGSYSLIAMVLNGYDVPAP